MSIDRRRKERAESYVVAEGRGGCLSRLAGGW
jgi:hypothetical protein